MINFIDSLSLVLVYEVYFLRIEVFKMLFTSVNMFCDSFKTKRIFYVPVAS